ncbi:hypothetical protein BDZ89DRAFT_747686 [Hymenopellis radicata]|nr:hypothetical protein BDZ89DRAFT_747686 [Hymenopellis radicata]
MVCVGLAGPAFFSGKKLLIFPFNFTLISDLVLLVRPQNYSQMEREFLLYGRFFSLDRDLDLAGLGFTDGLGHLGGELANFSSVTILRWYAVISGAAPLRLQCGPFALRITTLSGTARHTSTLVSAHLDTTTYRSSLLACSILSLSCDGHINVPVAAMYASDPQLAENSSNYSRTYAHAPSLRIILAVAIDLDLTLFGFMASFEHVGYEFVLRLNYRTISVSNGATEALRAFLAAHCSYNEFSLKSMPHSIGVLRFLHARA